jgi:hypothetical protein
MGAEVTKMKDLLNTLATICFAILVIYFFWFIGALVAQGGMP